MMATRYTYTGNTSTRRHPRTLQEAFPRDHALWHDIPRRTKLDTVCWVLAVLFILSIFFAPYIYKVLQ